MCKILESDVEQVALFPAPQFSHPWEKAVKDTFVTVCGNDYLKWFHQKLLEQCLTHMIYM